VQGYLLLKGVWLKGKHSNSEQEEVLPMPSIHYSEGEFVFPAAGIFFERTTESWAGATRARDKERGRGGDGS